MDSALRRATAIENDHPERMAHESCKPPDRKCHSFIHKTEVVDDLRALPPV